MTLLPLVAEGCNILYEGDKKRTQGDSFYFKKMPLVAICTMCVRRGDDVSIGANEMNVVTLCSYVSVFEEKVR